jgi:hypothetical protein
MVKVMDLYLFSRTYGNMSRERRRGGEIEEGEERRQDTPHTTTEYRPVSLTEINGWIRLAYSRICSKGCRET